MKFPPIKFPREWGYEPLGGEEVSSDIEYANKWFSCKEWALTSGHGDGDVNVASRLLLFTTLINKADQDLYQQKIINRKIEAPEDRMFYCRLLNPQSILTEILLERIILRSILPILDLILEEIPDIVNRPIHGEPLLYVSLRSQKSDVFERLLEKKPNINLCQKRTIFQSIGLACFWSIAEKKQQIENLKISFRTQKHLDSQVEASIFGDEANLTRWDTTTKEYLDWNNIYNEAKSTLHERAIFLCYAASNGHIDILRWCLNDRTGLFYYDDDDLFCELECHKDNLIRNALLWACYSNQLRIVKYLVETLKADVNKPVKMIKSMQKHLGTSEFHDNETPPLHIASRFGHIDLVGYLVTDAKAKLDSADKNGWTALMMAIEFKEMEVIKFLITNGASIECKPSRSYREHSVGYNLKDLIKSFPMSPFDHAPFLNSVRSGDVSTVEFFLHPRAEVFFLGKDEMKREMTVALKLARENGHTRTSHRLEEHLSKKLVASITGNEIKELKYWVEAGASINEQNAEGMTPSQWAIEKNKSDCLRELITLKADCSRQNTHGNILRLLAQQKPDHPEIIAMLTAEEEREATEPTVDDSLLRPDEEGNTALHRTVMEKKFESIETLIKPWASINQKNEQGKTALAIALENKYEADDNGRRTIFELRHAEKEKEIFNIIALLNSDLSFEETPYVGAEAKNYRIKLFSYHELPDYLLRVIKQEKLQELNFEDELNLQRLLSRHVIMKNGSPTQFLFSTPLKGSALYSILLETKLIGSVLKNKLESIRTAFDEKTIEDFKSTLIIQEEFPNALTLEYKSNAKFPREDSQPLWRYSSRNKSFKQIAVIFRQIALGLDVIHDFLYIHRDLNYGNILLRLNQNNQVTAVKLIDYGKSQRLDEEGRCLFKGSSAINCHSPQFICQEALSKEKKSDVIKFVGIAEDHYQFALLLYGVLLERDYPDEERILNHLKGVSKTTDSAYYCGLYSTLVYEWMEKEYNFCIKGNSLSPEDQRLLGYAFDLIKEIIMAPSATSRQQINLLGHPFLLGADLSSHLLEANMEPTAFITQIKEQKASGFQAASPTKFGSPVNLFRESPQAPGATVAAPSLPITAIPS